MTPFGKKIRALRKEKGASQKEMAIALGVSAAYLSALEHGRRGRPTFGLLQNIIGYFDLIWDDAEEIAALARFSHPRIVIDTSELPEGHTYLANKLADCIHRLDNKTVDALIKRITKS